MEHALKVSVDFSAGHGYRWSRHKGNRKSDVNSWPELSQNLSAVCLLRNLLLTDGKMFSIRSPILFP